MNITQIKKSPLGGFRGLLLAALIGFNACNDWIDVVPEGVATIDMVFNSRVQAIKYLGACYAYTIKNGKLNYDPAMLGGDELWPTYMTSTARIRYDAYFLAQGMQNATEPLLEFWGSGYCALRYCNTFLENIDKVPDMPEWERAQWKAEATVLKAYYHFWLVQYYGSVPLVRENIPVSADVSKVKVVREPVDDCFQYIVELLDEAIEGDRLPKEIDNVNADLGRITKPIAMALKAKVLVVAASPLFNGNEQQAALVNRDGTQLFNTKRDDSKWEKAMVACKEAIDACDDAGIMLYDYSQFNPNRLTDTIATQMSLRAVITTRFNREIIWANTNSVCGSNWDINGGSGLQIIAQPRLNPAWPGYSSVKDLHVPLKIAHLFHTSNGVPLADDNTRKVSELYDLRTSKPGEYLYVKENGETVDLHFDREPRFYAWLGFDCGIWYGQGKTNDKEPLFSLDVKVNGLDQMPGFGTGYLPKKLIPYTNVVSSNTSCSYTDYPWTIMRLSDLYLLYAEAINEAEGPNGPNSNDMFEYLRLVRARAGLKANADVRVAWENYTDNPSKYKNQTGMREIIRQERLIELCFEGHRFWDIRRWKIVPDLYRTPIEGWNFKEAQVANYYVPRLIYSQKFSNRDYFWPLQNSDVINNPNLVQNLDW